MWCDEEGFVGVSASRVEVMLGMRGIVTSRARALYRRICEVALTSPWGSAVTIMTPLWAFRLGTTLAVYDDDVVEKELLNRSSVILHWRKGITLG